jgi:hypothetical protein
MKLESHVKGRWIAGGATQGSPAVMRALAAGAAQAAL